MKRHLYIREALYALVLAGVYWVADSGIDALLNPSLRFSQTFFYPSRSEIIDRLVIFAALFLASQVPIIYETHTRQIATKLREQVVSFDALVNNVVEGIIIVRRDGDILWSNQRAVELLGWNPNQPRDAADFFDQETWQWIRTASEDGQATKPRRTQVRTTTNDLVPVELSVANIVWRGNNAVLVTLHDLRSRLQMEDALRRERDRARQYLEVAGVMMMALDVQGRVTMLNRRGAEILECSPEEVIGQDWCANFLAPAWRSRVRKVFQEIVAGNATLYEHHENPILTRSGKELIISWHNVPLYDEKGHIVGILSSGLDVTEERRMQRQLAANQARLHELLENANDVIYLHDLEGRLLSVNRRGQRALGWSHKELQARRIQDFLPTERDRSQYAQTLAALQKQETALVQVQVINRAGELLDWEIGVRLVREADDSVTVQGIARDITERKRLEEQLLRVSRLQAVGQLAGGVAHDFNNLLTVINGYCQLILDDLDPSADHYSEIEEIYRAGQRAAELTQRLLAFSRKQIMRLQPVNLNLIVGGLIKMLRRLIGEDIELQVELADDLMVVQADPVQVEQILVNLAANARDAMPKGGRLVVRTANVTLDEDYVQGHSWAVPGQYVALTVSDSGTGMTPDVVKHIFEPFFTTKGIGEGTGLGLAAVYGTVKQMGGYINVDTAPGQGTTFTIYLPPDKGQTTEGASQDPERESALPRGHETILVVEDEPRVRQLTSHMLKRLGYTALEAQNADEALGICQQQSIDLVLSDVVMPGLSGYDLAERLRNEGIRVPVLLMSGHSEQAIQRHGGPVDEISLLRKPFGLYDLAHQLRYVLNHWGSSTSTTGMASASAPSDSGTNR